MKDRRLVSQIFYTASVISQYKNRGINFLEIRPQRSKYASLGGGVPQTPILQLCVLSRGDAL